MVDYVLVPHTLKTNLTKMVIEKVGQLDTGSDHKVVWCIMKMGKLKQEDRFKWRVDGRTDWEEYQ